MFWLKSRKFDLSFLILSPILSLLLAAVYLFYNQPVIWAVPLYLLFSAFFDQPHIFLTVERTHLDPIERKRHFPLHTLGLLMIIGLSFWAMKHQQLIFLQVFQLLGSYHIFRQNCGFFRLYGFTMNPKKQRDRIEFVYAAIFIFSWATGMFDEALGISFQVITWIGAGMVGYLLFLSRHNLKNPGIWLLVLTIAVNWIAFHYIDNELVGTAVETLYHDIQYFAFSYLYMQRSNKRKPTYITGIFSVAILFGVITTYLADIKSPMITYNFIATLMLGIIIYHYIIEAFIWRFGTQPELHAILKNPAA